jgi:hypothetical protein
MMLSRRQRHLLSKSLAGLTNLDIVAFMFGQLTAPETFRVDIFVLGMGISFYAAAIGFAKD